MCSWCISRYTVFPVKIRFQNTILLVIISPLMTNQPKVELDLKNRRVLIDGSNCLVVIDACQAMCCKGLFNVDITLEEFKSGLYQSHPFCLLSGKECENKKESCINRKYRLDTREGGICVYLDEKNRCSIHKKSPAACKEFVCTGGWRVYYDFDASPQKLRMKFEDLKNDMVFSRNPITELLGIMYIKDRKEIIFHKKVANKCGTVADRVEFGFPAMDEKKLLYLVRLFDGKAALKEVLSKFKKRYDTGLARQDLHAIVRKLYYQGVIIFTHKR